VAIHLRPLLPTAFAQARATYLTTQASSPRTPSQARRPSWSCSGRGLPSHPSHLGCWWSLTPPFHPDPASRLGGLLSVALSRGSLRVGVAHRPALWSPDFPRPLAGPRSPGRLVRGQCTGQCCQARGTAHPVSRISMLGDIGVTFALQRLQGSRKLWCTCRSLHRDGEATMPVDLTPVFVPLTVAALTGVITLVVHRDGRKRALDEVALIEKLLLVDPESPAIEELREIVRSRVSGGAPERSAIDGTSMGHHHRHHGSMELARYCSEVLVG
jgi:hypothetical protein